MRPILYTRFLLATALLSGCTGEDARRRAEAEKHAQELEKAHKDGAKYRKEMNEGTTDAIRRYEFPNTSKQPPVTPGGKK